MEFCGEIVLEDEFIGCYVVHVKAVVYGEGEGCVMGLEIGFGCRGRTVRNCGQPGTKGKIYNRVHFKSWTEHENKVAVVVLELVDGIWFCVYCCYVRFVYESCAIVEQHCIIFAICETDDIGLQHQNEYLVYCWSEACIFYSNCC